MPKTKEKIKVYCIYCEATDLFGIRTDNLETVKHIIEGDIDSNSNIPVEGLEYKITIEMMTKEKYNSLPEYEG